MSMTEENQVTPLVFLIIRCSVQRYIAAVTNYQWLKTTNIYSPTVQEVRSPKSVALGLNSPFQQGHFLLEVLWGEFIFLPLASHGLLYSLDMAPPFIFKENHSNLYFCHHIPFPCDPDWLLSFLEGSLVLHWTHMNNPG